MSLKPEKCIEWIRQHGVQGAAWVYGRDERGFTHYKLGPKGVALTPVGGTDEQSLFVPYRVWAFIKRRLEVTPRTEASMYRVV